MAITIRDVARRLNLSITTVSRALDGYSDVAEETRKLVVKTAREMGYTPNRAARQLRRQRSDTIGYIVPASAPQFSDPFFSEFIAGLGDEAAAQNYDLLVSAAPPNSPAENDLYNRWVQGHRVDGMIINRTRVRDWRLRYLAESKMPWVSLEPSQDNVQQIGIFVDNKEGITAIMDHLFSIGHRHIAYVGAELDLTIQADRFSAFLDSLQRLGLAQEPDWIIDGDLTQQGGFLAAQRLLALRTPPTAIVCVNDQTAIGVLHAAHVRGRVVGQDLAVTGFDGLNDAIHTEPPLTTVNQPVYEIARRLVKMLLAQIQNQPLEERQVRLAPELIIRTSTSGVRESVG